MGDEKKKKKKKGSFTVRVRHHQTYNLRRKCTVFRVDIIYIIVDQYVEVLARSTVRMDLQTGGWVIIFSFLSLLPPGRAALRSYVRLLKVNY